MILCKKILKFINLCKKKKKNSGYNQKEQKKSALHCNVPIQYTNYSFKGQNLLFFCFNLLKSIIYLLSKFKFDIIKKEIYQFKEKLSREWSIIVGFKNYKTLSKLFKLSDSEYFQLKLNIVSSTK